MGIRQDLYFTKMTRYEKVLGCSLWKMQKDEELSVCARWIFYCRKTIRGIYTSFSHIFTKIYRETTTTTTKKRMGPEARFSLWPLFKPFCFFSFFHFFFSNSLKSRSLAHTHTWCACCCCCCCCNSLYTYMYVRENWDCGVKSLWISLPLSSFLSFFFFSILLFYFFLFNVYMVLVNTKCIQRHVHTDKIYIYVYVHPSKINIKLLLNKIYTHQNTAGFFFIFFYILNMKKYPKKKNYNVELAFGVSVNLMI